jgi:hypothetical protein
MARLSHAFGDYRRQGSMLQVRAQKCPVGSNASRRYARDACLCLKLSPLAAAHGVSTLYSDSRPARASMNHTMVAVLARLKGRLIRCTVPGSAIKRQCLAVVGSVHAGWPWASVTSAHADSII